VSSKRPHRQPTFTVRADLDAPAGNALPVLVRLLRQVAARRKSAAPSPATPKKPGRGKGVKP
jgi:hypothetical protein